MLKGITGASEKNRSRHLRPLHRHTLLVLSPWYTYDPYIGTHCWCFHRGTPTTLAGYGLSNISIRVCRLIMPVRCWLTSLLLCLFYCSFLAIPTFTPISCNLAIDTDLSSWKFIPIILFKSSLHVSIYSCKTAGVSNPFYREPVAEYKLLFVQICFVIYFCWLFSILERKKNIKSRRGHNAHCFNYWS